jgi:peptidoglycan/LPS O-acetylase OafA/YrhL
MFLLGAYVSTNKNIQKKILSINALVYLTLYLISCVVASNIGLGIGNNINVISYVLLCLLVFKLAFTQPNLSETLLSGNDISYGVYIYHMPIINLLLYYGIHETTISFALSFSLTFFLAMLSWIVIEKPSLKLKKIAFRKYS